MEGGWLRVCGEEERLLLATIAQYFAVLAVEGPCTILVQLLCYVYAQLSVPTSFVPRPHHHALFDCQYAIRIKKMVGLVHFITWLMSMFTGVLVENGFLVILKSVLVESGRLESTRFMQGPTLIGRNKEYVLCFPSQDLLPPSFLC